MTDNAAQADPPVPVASAADDVGENLSDAASPGASAARVEGGLAGVLASIRRWWLTEVTGAVDQVQVIADRREECLLSERYLFMIAMSAGIAVVGLLQSSTAVVIGAMLLSPLMGPIMGLGFALAIGDYHWLKQSARSLAWGSAIAVLLCALIVYVSPIKTITPEIAARTEPTLFDLLVALFSGMAGAYAMIRGRAGTIVGVAIATALMPPLATVGFGLATVNGTVFSGALLLFITNLITIALTAWAMARLYGFRSRLSERQTQAQNFAVVLVFILLAIPLGYSLQQIAWEANAQRIVRSEIEETFDPRSEVFNLETDFNAEPLAVAATVFTPVLRQEAEIDIERALTKRLGRPVELTLVQDEVGTNAGAAEQAQLSAAREREEAAARARADALALRLALVAGVGDEDVTIDRTRRRAVVRARPLEGANVATYRALEARISATEQDWTIEVIPPAAALPTGYAFNEEGLPTAAARRALETVAWAAGRVDLPVVLVGNGEEAELAQAFLEERGVAVERRGARGELRAEWGAYPAEE
ncbi:MAG: TIGR00341 family protein [Erythrobacter sp.]|jgi:uncharacterized hydrophobic protein (TIGR00271 family)|nr:TIGR00341 family protein [Erythrobacter sp.]